MQDTMSELIDQAHRMLVSKNKNEQDLIYRIANLHKDSRLAIIMAYRNYILPDSILTKPSYQSTLWCKNCHEIYLECMCIEQPDNTEQYV